MTKWYQKASVQSAMVGGAFLLATALVSGIFILLTDGDSEDGDDNAKNQIRDLRDDANWVKGVYELIDQPAPPGDSDAATVRERAPFVAKQFLGVADRHLPEGYSVIKYCYAGMLFVLAGQVEPDKNSALKYAKSAQDALANCNAEIQIIEVGAGDNNEEHHRILRWIGRNSYKDWMAYNTAIALSLRARSGDSVRWGQIEQALSRMSPPYLERNPETENFTLTWACRNLGVPQKTEYCKGV